MKKHLSIILTIIMAFSLLTACGSNNKNVLAEKSLEDILTAVYEQKQPEFPLMSTNVDLTDEQSVTYFTGLSKEDTSKVKEVLVSEPAMGSQAYSLVLLRLNDSKDAESIAKAVKNGVDPRKWICVEADDLRACAHGDVIMFVMISSQFADSITAEDLTNAFKEVADGNLSVELN